MAKVRSASTFSHSDPLSDGMRILINAYRGHSRQATSALYKPYDMARTHFQYGKSCILSLQMTNNHVPIRVRPRRGILDSLDLGSIVPAPHGDHLIVQRVAKEGVKLFTLEGTILESQGPLRC